MRLWSDSFSDGGVIAPACAFALIDPATHVRLAANRNPQLAWDEVPSGTESLILFCHDIDAPTVATNVNQPGQVVPEALARTDFYHWTLADIPLALKAVAEGQFSDMVTPRGKAGPQAALPVKNGTEHHVRQGLNDYTGWFAADPDMAGQYFGYDGPCPPWNDQRVHTYVFTLYALDIARLPLEGAFTGPQAREAIRGHILDEAQVLGVYSLNPGIAATLA
ncbi:MAG: YbhB/YbcL family Raf kinase inhibitor-like protein [Pseudomonadota bacterium]